jgi:hypothetical protein
MPYQRQRPQNYSREFHELRELLKKIREIRVIRGKKKMVWVIPSNFGKFIPRFFCHP